MHWGKFNLVIIFVAIIMYQISTFDLNNNLNCCRCHDLSYEESGKISQLLPETRTELYFLLTFF
jgi:hypothetical protein